MSAFFRRTRPVYDGNKVTTYGIKLDEAIPSVLSFGLCARMSLKDDELHRYLDKVVFSEDVAAIKVVLAKQSAKAQSNLTFALATQPLKINSLRLNRV